MVVISAAVVVGTTVVVVSAAVGCVVAVVNSSVGPSVVGIGIPTTKKQHQRLPPP